MALSAVREEYGDEMAEMAAGSADAFRKMFGLVRNTFPVLSVFSKVSFNRLFSGCTIFRRCMYVIV